MDWHGNEDAGDMRAFNDADYHAEMALERDGIREAEYVELWDSFASRRPQPVVSYFEISPAVRTPSYQDSEGRWVHTPFVPRKVGRVLYKVSGPMPIPYCEECGEDVHRNNPEGCVDRRDGVLLCSQACKDAYRSYSGGYDEQEDFGADNNGPIGDWWYGD